ncbi:MAG TPA: ABC transporter ATP-binding protein [Devosia sp.]|jgi:ABC-type sugar transport system ATPase subunit|uniref:ABC transporter ATP-binding protein n=1 Tax=Devosia sp. TaxID=1871048 RepID=UPI002F93832E
MADVVLASVGKRYGGVEVIPPLDLTIQDGSFTVLVGPSGCGKSTLLRMIAGLEDVSHGVVAIGGDDVTHVDPSQRGVAMVFQSYALYPHMTVEENIGFGLRLSGMPREEIVERVGEAAATLQLTPLIERRPRQLSGGQRQRVAIGRAIVRKPRVFLFDEPLSNLDAALRAQMRVELAELHRRLGATMIYVTHDQVEAMTMADRIVVLNAGRIEQAGSPMELYREPATPFVAAFLGSPKMNLISGDAAASLGGEMVGIRPEHLRIKHDGRWGGTIRHVEHLGSETLIHAELDGVGPVTAKVEGESVHAPGDLVRMGFDPSHLHVFVEGRRQTA